ncbi:uncharacterized protein LOC142345461 [Convolutriloba macropyga]|uniref:uncharacterized protein LOC142345461 n=1 Tax=Convolutriloba macropyga TaxID=536237 RepID=UPI003F520B71
MIEIHNVDMRKLEKERKRKERQERKEAAKNKNKPNPDQDRQNHQQQQQQNGEQQWNLRFDGEVTDQVDELEENSEFHQLLDDWANEKKARERLLRSQILRHYQQKLIEKNAQKNLNKTAEADEDIEQNEQYGLILNGEDGVTTNIQQPVYHAEIENEPVSS